MAEITRENIDRLAETYTRDSFDETDGDTPYTFILAITDINLRAYAKRKFRNKAKAVKFGVGDFDEALKAAQEAKTQQDREDAQNNHWAPLAELPALPELAGYIVDEHGVGKYEDKTGYKNIIKTPLVFLGIIYDIEAKDGKGRKVDTYWHSAEDWRHHPFDAEALLTSGKVSTLGAFPGLNIASGKGADFTEYAEAVLDAGDKNGTISSTTAATRCGFYPGHGFVPYNSDLVFVPPDGNTIAPALHSHGDKEKNRETLTKAARASDQARAVIAAALASILVEPLNAPGTIINLLGLSSTGKSVTQRAAATLFGDPGKDGKGVFRKAGGTKFALEREQVFLNHLPFILDDAEQMRDADGDFICDIYQMTTGQTREKGRPDLTTAPTQGWAQYIIISSENPIVRDNGPTGERVRVITLKFTEANAPWLGSDQTATEIYFDTFENYGFFGPEFIAAVYADDQTERQRLEKKYKAYQEKLTANGYGKQAQSWALIQTADDWARDHIYTGERLPDFSPDFIEATLIKPQEASAGLRGWEFVRGWIAAHDNDIYHPERKVLKYNEDGNPERLAEIPRGTIIGKQDNDDGENTTFFISTTELIKALKGTGYNPGETLDYMQANGRLIPGPDGRRQTKRLIPKGSTTGVYVIKIPNAEDAEEPF